MEPVVQPEVPEQQVELEPVGLQDLLEQRERKERVDQREVRALQGFKELVVPPVPLVRQVELVRQDRLVLLALPA